MARLAVLVLLSILLAASARAQVINGETPLDETPISRATPSTAGQARVPTTPSPAEQEPTRRDLPQTAPRRD